ncbi:ATP-grasp domain-containing protein [Novosphingobium sp. M1R2S20]|uniref:ATP-grasp domain-containing protein n=1 Tax=Novosphingobium rhizovicinum TaxID=3228928 RepID=A0ABV3RIJ6_9SPHN
MQLVPLKALVTGGGAVLGQGIIKALRGSSLKAEIIAVDPNPLSSGLYWADRGCRIPMASQPGYRDAIWEVVARENPDIIFVGTDVELSFFAEHRASLEATFGTKVVVSDPRVVAIAEDKFDTFRFMQSKGFNPPASALPEETVALSKLIEQVGFPLVVKPRIGARSAGVSVVHDKAALDRALEGRRGLVVQECVGSDETEYTAGVVVFDGKTQASIVLRRDLRDGNTYRAYAGNYSALDEQVRAFGEALAPFGPANFQFRTDADGTARVFEINARFSGTTPMRAMLGFNEVEMCLRKLLYETRIEQPQGRPGVILRYLQEMYVPEEQIAAVV